MAINVTGNIANIAVNTTSNVVTVSSSPVNVQLSATSVVSNTSVRQALSVSNVSGFGNITYDNSNTSNGVIQYVGTSTSDVRGSISNASPITYNSSTGVIGLEQSLDDITLKKYQETVVAHGNSSGNIEVDVANGTIHTFTLTGNVTKITTPNIATGGSATIILTQDGVGNNVLDTTTFPLEWVNWDFVNDFKSLDVSANAFNIVNVLWDGSKYYASLVVDSEISPTDLAITNNLTVGANITANGNISGAYILGDGSQLTGVDNNADVKAYIEANGLDATANITTTANLSANHANLTTANVTGLLTVNGEVSIGGNLDVTGNINSQTVTDLFVEDRNITLQAGQVGTPSANSQIFIERGTSPDTYIKWDESTDKWKFSNDGTVEYELFQFDGSNITATNANIDSSVNIAENSGANGSLTLHANTSTTVYPNVVLYAPGMARMSTSPTAFATRLSPNGLENNKLSDDNVTYSSNGFSVDLTAAEFFMGNITGTDSITMKVENSSDFTGNPSTDLSRGKLRINKQGASAISSAMTDIVTYEDLQLFNVPFGGQVQLNNGAQLGTNKTLGGGTAGTNSIDVSGQIRSTDKIYTDGSGNIEAAGYVVGNDGVRSPSTITGQNVVANANVNAQIMIASGNITGANINANYFHGDGSNLTGIAGDIESVTAGSGLTGGGSSGAVTLDVGAGTGITVNPDNVAVDMSAFSTSDLSEGTNLYYTDSRFDTRLGTKSTSDLSEGSNLYFTAARARGNISVGTPASASGGGSLAYDSSTGEFTFTPADSVTTATNATNATNVAITDDTSTDAPHYVALSPAATGNQAIEVSSSKLSFNPASGTLQTDNITSGTSANLTLTGQQNGVHLNKTVDSVNSRVLDVDTTGYAIGEVSAGLPATTTLGDFAPSMIVSTQITSGSNQFTVADMASGGYSFAGLKLPALRGPVFATQMTGTSLANVITGIGVNVPFVNTGENGISNVSAGLYGQTKGWNIFNVATGSRQDLFPIQAYVTDITGDVVTMSENAIASTSAGHQVALTPGMTQSSDANTMIKYLTTPTNAANSAINDASLYGRLGSFEHAETLANLTYDHISYANTSTITFTSIDTKQSADMNSGSDSAVRYPRLLSVGPSTTPDPFSGRIETNNPSPIGVTVEDDGETYSGNNAPYSKFLFNTYTGNFDDMTQLPNWAGAGNTGNTTLDLNQLKAPSLQFKSFRGTKSDGNLSNYLMKAGEVVGKISWAPGQTTGLSVVGADLYNPSSAITVDVGDADMNSGAANTHMHITTCPFPLGGSIGYFRNNANADTGTNSQTNFTTKGGNVTIAAQTDGMITLAPTPDYGDSSNSSVWTRRAGSTHEYHTYLDAKFESANATSKSGTIIEIQPKSGTTTGSGGLGYDSVGNATLRISSHHSNSDVKAQWDIINDQSSGNLVIRDHTNSQDVMHFDGSRVFVDESLRLQNLTTAEINALASPQAGDIVYNTTLNQVCFYNGTAWQKITSATM